ELPPRTEAVGRPVWSSDSRMIAFTSENWDRISDISTDVMVIDVETHDVTNLSQSGAFDNSPIWSPDNRYVVFISMRDGQSELYVADIQTGNLRRLTYTPENEGDITWQPRP
ncbi:MAG: DPP IV N-terminal domain-containing protein, partial [Chloroflexota bacterium]